MVQVGVESENGWRPARATPDLTEWVAVPGTNVRLQFMKGWPLQILRAWAADYNAYIEPLRDPDSAAWTPTNSVATSNHLNGTACDLNWNTHPFRVRGTFTAGQMATLRQMLDFYEGTVFWAGDWNDPIDEMHHQMGYGTWNNPKTGDFVKRKIRADGYSTFRRGGTVTPPAGPDAVDILSSAMGGRLSLDRYRQLLPAVAGSLKACECTTVDRIAMWCAQIGHESGGLYYTEEIASGSAYEGRADLGNTQPGDGVRFKGRSWIQITGRSNYTRLSQWAAGKGLVPSPTFFVDNPAELAADEYAGLGAAWYWVVARPDINALSDRRDLDTVTRRINGGTNGIDDRRDRYNRALALGEQLLTLIGGDVLPEEDSPRYASQSIYATPGEGAIWTAEQLIRNVDGMVHALYVEASARLGDPDALHRVALNTTSPDPYIRARAVNLMAEIERDNPDMLKAFLAQNGAAK